ncbi:MAG: endolytic transglycosylase MltG [Ignavibacteriaceae bacterium]|nr:endolytic transglycosylase MltG [Ignavibacteriaceae bacterium]
MKILKLLTPKQYIVVVSFFFIVLITLYYIFFTGNYFSGASPRRFEIKRGETLNSITEKLFSDGIIPNKTNFKIAAFIYGAEKKIRAARYYIPNGLNYLELVELFLWGKADYLRLIKIYEGSTIHSTAASLKLDALIDSTYFVQVATSKQYLDSLGIFAESVQGYLLPGEYYIYERSNPREVINLIFAEFSKFFNNSLAKFSKDQQYSLHELVTLASIVEGETNKESEMPIIAGVYFNRLKKRMKLQADPTIQFLQKNGWKRLNHSDLNIESPYNTYKYFGLPPGPINNPGKAALKAAFTPEKHNYLFFVADGTGGHKFAENYSKHLKFVKEYRTWLRSQQ